MGSLVVSFYLSDKGLRYVLGLWILYQLHLMKTQIEYLNRVILFLLSLLLLLLLLIQTAYIDPPT